MARPSTEIIETYNIIEQFQRCGLKTVINLQRPGEHASCGNPLEQESAFTYRPDTFMKAGIYYYNFGWKDYGVASLTTILDMVKVMSFAVQEGRMAVHCHAGLGRTGVLLACYLVFTSRMSADQAILFVRAKRPNSIQTRGQLLCVREFAQFLVPLRSIFSCAEPKASAVTLSQYLTRQRHLLHGYEARQMKNVPKILQLVCRLLVDIAANRQVVMEAQVPDLTAEVEKTVSQQALQQLGKEMRGKGITVPPCSSLPLHSRPPPDEPLPGDNELLPLQASLSNCRSLSYSDSVLDKRVQQQQHLGPLKSNTPINGRIKHSRSHSSLTVGVSPRCDAFSAQDVISSIQGFNMEAKQDNGSSLFKKQLHEGPQGVSLDLTQQGRTCPCAATLPALSTRSEVDVSAGAADISVQSDLSPEGRCLLVAHALALDQADKEFTSKVSIWQTELNSREGSWERLCMERDPWVLSALMWSWLEQLKDPVISREDVKALRKNHKNPQNSLDSLEKGPCLTLLCVLHCAAHLLPLPELTESRLLNQTIKVFTQIDPASEKDTSLYSTLKGILTPILHELCDKAAEESEHS
ncbi:hypothetical protein CesoFtcFv8_001733 [Champsocephalus esox]|uniref:Protein tyrosine phosphatase domain-containing protein 1 n=1 Tax=Champsocephalus esox TaxID=159716 RepID=A0AAN8HE06_9TELE|nr:hypothetical protein CesoFtcFv8_001733 [Champsocephalus esox]